MKIVAICPDCNRKANRWLRPLIDTDQLCFWEGVQLEDTILHEFIEIFLFFFGFQIFNKNGVRAEQSNQHCLSINHIHFELLLFKLILIYGVAL